MLVQSRLPIPPRSFSTLLSGKRHCECIVSLPKLQHTGPAQGLNLDGNIGVQRANDEHTVSPEDKRIIVIFNSGGEEGGDDGVIMYRIREALEKYTHAECRRVNLKGRILH